MAQIEAYLRTGEGPPPAPEPAASPSSRRFRPFDDDDSGTGVLRARGTAPATRFTARLPVLWGRLRPGRSLSARLRLRGPARGSGPETRPRAPGEPPRWTPARAIVVVAVLAGLVLLPVFWSSTSKGHNPDGVDRASTAPAGPGYMFLMVNRSGAPVRWNPCAPIYYQLDLAAAPSWAETDIGNAIATISSATGIQFVYDGPTNQFPNGSVPVGAGTAESPVVIAWANVQQSQSLNMPVKLAGASVGSGAGPVAGPAGGVGGAAAGPAGGAAAGPAAAVTLSGSSGGAALSAAGPARVSTAGAGASGGGKTTAPAVDTDALARTVPVVSDDQVTGHLVYVSGSVVISAAATDLSPGFVAGGDGVLLLHELGRLVGLAELPDGAQVMNPDVLATSVTGLGPGDRAGLKRLGSASGCLSVPANGSLEPVL